MMESRVKEARAQVDAAMERIRVKREERGLELECGFDPVFRSLLMHLELDKAGVHVCDDAPMCGLEN